MLKQGDEFESLTELIFKKLINNSQFDSVRKNVKIDGKDGKRQIDILLETKTAGFELKTIIECKDFGIKVSVGKVDELHSKMNDVNANKGILVSRKGFSSMAISKAKRLGISLCTAHEALSTKWDIDVELPILITEIYPIHINPVCKFVTTNDTAILKNALNNLNDENISELFKNNWITGNVVHNINEKEQVYTPTELKPPFYIRDINNQKIQVKEFKITFALNLTYYFGYLDKQRNTQLLKNITEGTNTLFVNSELITNYKEIFKKIKKDEIPKFKTVNFEIKSYPSINILSENYTIEEIASHKRKNF